MTTYESLSGSNLPEGDGLKRIMDRLAEDRETAVKVKQHKWAQKTNRQKAETLLEKLNPHFLRESDLPKIALAQVHATFAMEDALRGRPEGMNITYERIG